MKFKVDENSCIGCGACTGICEELFEISDDGYAVCKDENVTDEDIKDRALSAMECCPTGAIKEEKEEEK